MRELTKEEGEALTKDLQAVLEKHNADMGVVANIQLLKRDDEIGTAETEKKGEEVK